MNDKETIKALKQEIAELKREKQVFRQLIQDSYKTLLKHTNNDDKPRNKEELKDYRPVFD